jgi:hypothetical protein
LDKDRKWDPVNYENNAVTPEKLKKAVANALVASDGFVWVYNERPTWLLDSAEAKLGNGIDFGSPERNQVIKWVPRVYWEALRDARQLAYELKRREESGEN